MELVGEELIGDSEGLRASERRVNTGYVHQSVPLIRWLAVSSRGSLYLRTTWLSPRSNS